MIRSTLLRCALILGVFAPALAANPARSQDTYPTRAINLVVTFAPGAGSDVRARMLAKDLGIWLGVPVLVHNKPGANGAVGAVEVARSKPDGYTLMVGTATTSATNHAFYAGKLGYEPSSFDIVGTLGSSPISLYSSAGEPWQNVADLVAASKKAPGTMNCGSGNATTQVACELFRKHAGIDVATIPYKSNAQAFTAVIGGHLSYTFSDAPAALSFVESKRVRALAVASEKRSPTMPAVATFQEQGIPDFEITAWSAIFAPAGTPAPILEKLNGLIRKHVTTPEAAQLNARTGGVTLDYDLAQARRFAADEVARWARYVKETGVKPEQ